MDVYTPQTYKIIVNLKKYKNKMKTYNSLRTQAVLNIKKNQSVWANFSSTDCDGCSSQSSIKIESVQHLIDLEKGFERFLEWADGSMNMWLVFRQDEVLEYYCGGSWGDY